MILAGCVIAFILQIDRMKIQKTTAEGGKSMIYLAEQIRALRLAQGYTQEEVASALHVSSQSISKWERGETCPDIALLPPLAHFFKTSIDALMGMDRMRSWDHMSETINRAHALFREEKYGEAAEVLREQRNIFPNDMSLASELAFCLCFDPSRLQEAIDLCEMVLRRDAPIKAQHTARAALAFMYAKQGNAKKAQETAGQLPHRRESREEVRQALAECACDQDLNGYIRYLVLGEKQ